MLGSRSGHEFCEPESDPGVGAERGVPEAIRYDNGPEFTSRQFLAWGMERKIELVHIEPGRQVQNAYAEPGGRSPGFPSIRKRPVSRLPDFQELRRNHTINYHWPGSIRGLHPHTPRG